LKNPLIGLLEVGNEVERKKTSRITQEWVYSSRGIVIRILKQQGRVCVFSKLIEYVIIF
jgi:hypothetical protein